jgi:hypothetical protein
MIFQLFAYGDTTGIVSAPEIARRLIALYRVTTDIGISSIPFK